MFCGIFPQIACILCGSVPESSGLLFFFFNNQRRVLFLLFERLGKPCQSSCRQLGELGYTGTTCNVEEKGKASWEQAGSAGLMCLTSQPVKCHRENLASEHGSAGGLQRREHPLKAHSPSPAQAGSRCICAQGGAPAHPARFLPLALTLQEWEERRTPHITRPRTKSPQAQENRGAPGGLRSLPDHPPARRPHWSTCEARHTPSCHTHRWCCPRVNQGDAGPGAPSA